MGHVVPTPAGNYRANWREPSGRQRSKTFKTQREAKAFLAQIEAAKTQGLYVSPHAGRTLFREHADRWMEVRRTEVTTAARDASVMRTHVLPQWGDWPLAKIDDLSVQRWVTELAGRRSQPVVAKCLQLTSAVMRSAVRNRLIATNPCEGVRVPKRRKRDSDGRMITREQLHERLLPAVPAQYRGVVALAAGCGLRWGEIAGLRWDAVDLEREELRVLRTVVEVAGHTMPKPYPKSRAGRRTLPVPKFAAELLREQAVRAGANPSDLVFPNREGKPLLRGLFRARIWRPSLVRAGLLGRVTPGEGGYEARWLNAGGVEQHAIFGRHHEAVMHVARHHAGGLRLHDLRHCYGTWLVSDGVPINVVQTVMGHERAATTLGLYVDTPDELTNRVRDVFERTENDPDDPDEGSAGVPAPAR
ncbi:hypothetical protein GCM10012275_48270 [Longimycelium tulufanense]|uniref:Tyr recombinase domain-containing protein n=1 Tax=Longimycelium tulufanense TaxID=907463 RepID=A0A8J3FWH8_9PSEU|nr:site-specific integrase [Longimycelium tulufanense]GGM72069.1 hypothetical protein GCM10012275_48270 [Longimycelium tulufanense]